MWASWLREEVMNRIAGSVRKVRVRTSAVLSLYSVVEVLMRIWRYTCIFQGASDGRTLAVLLCRGRDLDICHFERFMEVKPQDTRSWALRDAFPFLLVVATC